MAFVPFEFSGQSFLLSSDRALYWPAQRALIVADLHLEKASWYARTGQPLPPYDSHDTLDRLMALAREAGAERIWCLGDSFHDPDVAARIDASVARRLHQLTDGWQVVWIAGNHDGLTGNAWGGSVADEQIVDSVILRHQSLTNEARPELTGHFHPKLRLNLRGHHVARACFAGDDRRLILPAFGSLTGGLDVADPVIGAVFGGPYRAILVADGKLLSIPMPGVKPADATASELSAKA